MQGCEVDSFEAGFVRQVSSGETPRAMSNVGARIVPEPLMRPSPFWVIVGTLQLFRAGDRTRRGSTCGNAKIHGARIPRASSAPPMCIPRYRVGLSANAGAIPVKKPVQSDAPTKLRRFPRPPGRGPLDRGCPCDSGRVLRSHHCLHRWNLCGVSRGRAAGTQAASGDGRRAIGPARPPAISHRGDG